MFKRLRRLAKASRHARGSTSSPGTGLQVCTGCHADYVHPVEWHESDEEHWWMLLRCGACGSERDVTVADDVAKRFGEDRDRAERQIEHAVRELDGERMAVEVEAFAVALQRDLIGADDFAPRIGR
jgi:hypothetical protein